jgi:hypothetical protein
MKTKLILTGLFIVFSATIYSQKVSVKEINEKRSTSDDSYGNKCEIELKVSGDEARKFKFVKISKVSKAIDDRDLDLLNEEQTEYNYLKLDKDSKIELELKIPSRKAAVIKELSGEITLYNPTESNGGLVKIENYQSKTNTNLLPKNSPVQVVYLTKEFLEKYIKANKDKKEEELKKMPEIARKMAEALLVAFDGLFGFDEDDGSQAYFYINGDSSKFVELYFEDLNGKKIEKNSSASNNGLFSYSFGEKLNPNWKLFLSIESVTSTKKVPFKLLDVELP